MEKLSSARQVAFQGVPGAYSDQAARYAFEEAQTIPMNSFPEIFEYVESGELPLAAMPVENSTTGEVMNNYEFLRAYDVSIVGEIYFPIKHCLLGNPGATEETIKVVYSHPQALSQCEEYLMRYKVEAHMDTAGSAKMIAERGGTDAGAIASSLCSELYGVVVVKEGIQMYPDNTTHFYFIAPRGRYETEAADDMLTMLFIEYDDRQFDDDNSQFDDRGMRFLDKVQHEENWTIRLSGIPFFQRRRISLRGSVDDGPIQEILDELGKRGIYTKIAGSYPMGKDPVDREYFEMARQRSLLDRIHKSRRR